MQNGNITSYLNAKGALLGTPLAGNFELTCRCNFKCKMCYVHDEKQQQKELTTEEWVELGRQAADKGMLYLLITGGEPFLRPDFAQIYTAFRKMGLTVIVNTNGSLLTEEILETVVKYPPAKVNVSLYGSSDETYGKLCGRQAYHTVTENIIKMKKAGIPLRIHLTVTPYNAEDVEKIFAFAKEIDVPVKATAYMFPPVRTKAGRYGEAPVRLEAGDAARYQFMCMEKEFDHAEITKWAKGFETPDIAETSDLEGGEHMKCRAGKTAFWITWDGRMLPCGMFPVRGYSVQKLGFEKAWAETRKEAGRILLPKECISCDKRGRCAVCAASCMAETGASDKKPEYLCKMTQALKEIAAENMNNRNTWSE